jgi:hypothetical protein
MRDRTSIESIVWDARLEPSEPAPAHRELAAAEPGDAGVAERRLAALAAAVREHEGRVRAQLGGPRPHDRILHTRLRQILGAA